MSAYVFLGSLGIALLFVGLTEKEGKPDGAVARGRSFLRSLVPNKNRDMKRIRAAQEAWPQALTTTIAYLRSGASLGEGLIALSTRGPVALRAPFMAFAQTYRSTGNIRTSLDVLRREAADPLADRVCAALLLAHEVGAADLVRVLDRMCGSIRSDLRTRREVEARWSWTVVAARLAAVAPWVVLFLMLAKPEGRAAFASSEGRAVVLIGAMLTFVGYRAMLRAGRLPVPARLQR